MHERIKTFEYSPLERALKRLYRKFRPVPRSPWTSGPVDDISEVHLVPPERLVDFFSEAISELRNLKGENIGAYLEFGVFNGSSMGSFYEARKAVGAHSMRMVGFDAFEGLPADAEREDGGVWKKGFYACSFEDMEVSLLKRGVNPYEIEWVKGWYDQTLTEKTRTSLDLNNPGIIFIDCDTYSSSKAVLNFVAPMITSPAIICLDDWKLNDLDLQGMGEYQSFNEFLAENPNLSAISLPSYNRKSRTFLVKPI